MVPRVRADLFGYLGHVRRKVLSGVELKKFGPVNEVQAQILSSAGALSLDGDVVSTHVRWILISGLRVGDVSRCGPSMRHKVGSGIHAPRVQKLERDVQFRERGNSGDPRYPDKKLRCY